MTRVDRAIEGGGESVAAGRAEAEVRRGVPREPVLVAVVRGLALFFGLFSLINVAGSLRSAGFDATIWWLDLREWNPRAAPVFTGVLGVVLVAFAVRPVMRWPRRLATLLVVGVALAVAVDNVRAYYALIGRGWISTTAPVPISLLVAVVLGAVLAAVLWGLRNPRAHSPGRSRGVVALLSAGVIGVVGPLVQMHCFGKTDYRRPADAVVVFGARVYADGRTSDALTDRVRTASKLVKEGYAEWLVVSGGPGDGSVHETEAMAGLAESLGVPADRIIADRGGLNTEATARNTTAILADLGAPRVLAVSHGYHLPRIKLVFHRAGCEVYTVPAAESYVLKMTPYYLAREVAAQWVYYLRPLVG